MNGWINEDSKDTNKISFEFDINHPLYIPLFHLLNYDDELIIEDATNDELAKIKKIFKKS